MSNPVEIELKPLTDMITKMFGPDFVDFVKRQHGDIRSFYETSSAITQCANVVGKVQPNKSICWICGFEIPATSSPQDAFAPECEHIFPIAQALFFIGLYTSDIKDNREFVEKLKLEYDWAHRVCNQVKNDAHFIEHNIQNPNGRWNINKNSIGVFLNDILQRGNKYGGGANRILKEIKRKGLTDKQWISNQTDVIYNKCAAIISTIQPKNENLWILATVSDLALDYMNSGFEPEIIPPYMPMTKRAGFQPMTQQQVEAVYSQWAEYIMKKVNEFAIQYLAERLKRYTVEEKAFRSQKAIALLDRSLIMKVGQYIWPMYAQLPQDINKDVRFVEAVSYIISKVVIERIDRIFADEKSPAITKLRTQLMNNFINAVSEIWNSVGFNDARLSIDNLVQQNLKGARRRRKTQKRKSRR